MLNDYRLVAVGPQLHYSKTWKTVPDFLSDYFKQLLGQDWARAELGKPPSDRHPIMQWYEAYCLYQAKVIKKPGEVTSSEIIGVVACYLGLAYSLYLLHHNVELQARLLARLKDKGNFQGAYYELMVANTLIRAGFTLTLEDETDGQSKHCEFAATSGATGKRYWVEAKMRAVAGLLGRTEHDGTASDNPLSSFNKHLTGALAKPAEDDRLIFIDLNTTFELTDDQRPTWAKSLNAMLARYERNHPDARAYVIVTNAPFHRMLDEHPLFVAVPYGLGMEDFNRPGFYRLSQAYKNKRKHIDGFNICDALGRYLTFPSTFDGTLASEAFDGQSRLQIGETYIFKDADNLVGTVTAASVSEAQKKLHISVTDAHTGACHILVEDMTDQALAEYQANREAYFGEIRPVSRGISGPYELFEWLMKANEETSREKFIEWMSPQFPPGTLEAMSDEDLRATYCEGLVGHMEDARKASEQAAQAAKANAPNE